MKNYTKKQMVSELQLMEAQRWEDYKTHERLAILISETENQDDWTEAQRNNLSSYAREWLAVNSILKHFGINALSYLEREELKNKKIIK